jgi:diacylglycerol kinase family enzyme
LSVYVMRKNSRRGFIAASIRALLNRRRPNEMLELEQIERLRVASSRSMLEVSLDGEVVRAAPPLEYKIRKEALRVIAP